MVAVDTRLWRREFRRPGSAPAVVTKVRGLVRRLAAGRFDVAVDLQGLWKSGVITALTRAPLRVGLAAAALPGARQRLVHEPARDAAPRRRTWSTSTWRSSRRSGSTSTPSARRCFRSRGSPPPRRGWRAGSRKRASRPTTPLVLLNPGSGGDHKRWAVEAFRRLGEELAVRLGARVAITWGPGEEPLARAIAHGMRTGALVPPPTTITEMIALFRRASLVVGGDTGPVHVAAVLGVPTIGLYGPTSARRKRAVRSPGGGDPEPDRPDGRGVRRGRPRRGAGAAPLSRRTGWRACRWRSWC